MPFERLVDELQPERDLTRTPLFQAMFVFQNSPVANLRLAGLDSEICIVHNGTAKFDLTLYIEEVNGHFTGTVEYNKELFEGSGIERMCEHYTRVVESVIGEADCKVWDLVLMGEREQRQLMEEWQGVKADEAERCIQELFEEQVRRKGEATALVYGEERYSYEELEERANRVANYLRRKGVGPEDKVGIMMRRRPEMIIFMLGVLKAGGAYVPLDPVYPEQRLRYIVKDSGAKV